MNKKQLRIALLKSMYKEADRLVRLPNGPVSGVTALIAGIDTLERLHMDYLEIYKKETKLDRIEVRFKEL